MNQASDRVPCPKCQASNFANSAVCWQCGEPLPGPRAQVSNETPGGPTPPQVSNETPGGPAPGYEPPPPMAPLPVSDNSTLLIVLGFLCAVPGVFCCPIIFPVVGIILGAIVQRRGNKLGIWVIVTSVLFLVAGLVFTGIGVATYMNMMKHGGIPNPYNLPAPK